MLKFHVKVRGWNAAQRILFSTSLFVCRCSLTCIGEILQFRIAISRGAIITMLHIEGIRQILRDSFQTVVCTDHSRLWAAKFESCIPSDMKIKRSSVSLDLSTDLVANSTLLSSSICAYFCIPRPVHSLHCSIEAVQWCIANKPTLRGINVMQGVVWLQH